MIRDATLGDAARIAAAVHDQPLLVRYGVTRAGLQRNLEAAIESGERVIVDDDGQVRGFAWYLPRGGFGMGGYLKLIATATGGETKGVGRALLETIERDLEARQLFLLVSDFNTAAQRFYERAGYVRTGRLPSLVKPGIDELVYWRRLPAT
jgi:ribosomal protein S18 acetylase RimI-like enzyme